MARVTSNDAGLAVDLGRAGLGAIAALMAPVKPAEADSLRVRIRLTLHNRGGRPRILPPKEMELGMDRGQDTRLLRAIGRAWDWRRRLERGDVTTIADLARAEGFSNRHVNRVIRLAWPAPSVLAPRVTRRESTVLSIFDLCVGAELPWVAQPEKGLTEVCEQTAGSLASSLVPRSSVCGAFMALDCVFAFRIRGTDPSTSPRVSSWILRKEKAA